MFIDNSFFIRESPSLFPNYLRLEGLGYISKNGTYKVSMELPCNNKLLFKEVQTIIFEESNDKVFYTRLDLEQTCAQVQKNKYFKTFCGRKQLIQTER